MENLYEILPDFFIGTNYTLSDPRFNKLCKANIIINAEKDINEFTNIHQKYNNIEIVEKLKQYEIDKFVEYINKITIVINNALNNEKIVLIYCKNGVQISPTIAVAYLIKYGKFNIEEAINIMYSKVSNIFIPNIKYLEILKKITY